MSLVAFTKFRFLWGAVDWQHGSGNPYSTAQTGALGTSAAAGSGNIGVRRCLITFDRTSIEAGMDPAEAHLDFLNLTAGAPDDTWTTSDYTTLEGYIDTWLGAVKAYWGTGHRVTQYSWYRCGAGITPPNPAERVVVKGTPISSTSPITQQLQCAISHTMRTSVRRSWGRTYLPGCAVPVNPDGRMASTQVDTHANAFNALVTSAAGSDFYLGVTSLTLSAFLVAEHIEVDNVPDIIRRRRHRNATYKKILP